MTYQQIQNLKRQLSTGFYSAPDPIAIINEKPKPRTRRKLNIAETVDEWNEEAFNDDFYDGDQEGDEVDVAPEYFHHCEQLNTTYFNDLNAEDDVPSLPLFQGSEYTSKDLARFILSFKARHLKVGDGIIANIVAIMATFLPEDNTLKALLPQQTSTYLLLKTLDNLASFKTNLRTLQINCCAKKCMGYYGDNYMLNSCLICGMCRWKSCAIACYSEDGEKLCDHRQSPSHNVYYNVVQDRLVKLLKSDLKNLFDYESHRGGNCH